MKDIAKWTMYAGIFAIPFIPLIISSSLFFPFITGKNFTFRILVETVLVAWAILALHQPIYRPRFSWILATLAGFVGIMFFANLFGEYPPKSFWGNFERMEGYVTLMHLLAYVLVLSSALNTEKLWKYFLNTVLCAGVLAVFYAFAQLSGSIEIRQSFYRLDGTLGNATYMAVYMLFQIFLSIYLIVQTTSRKMQLLYAGLAALFLFILVQTATRGTMLGLAVGAGFTGLYLAIWGKEYPRVRKIAIAAVVAVIVLVGLLGVYRDSAFVEGNKYLERITNISLSEASTRFQLWGIALEGAKERPILGWGQENYNYVFNKYYDPSLYDQESWFDRVHNIFLDWLIAGGVLGLLGYLSILGSAVYYLAVRPFFHKDDAFTVLERGVLLGLLVGYMIHNLFVFDNIVSYLFYGMFLALVASRVHTTIPKVKSWTVSDSTRDTILAPVVLIVGLVMLYVVNVPGIRAASSLIDGLATRDPAAALDSFQKAFDQGAVGQQEVTEHMTRSVQILLGTSGIPVEIKNRARNQAESMLVHMNTQKPGDARLHLFLGSFYRSVGETNFALEQFERARAVSLQKQEIIFQQGITHIARNEYDDAFARFKEAYELDRSFARAAAWYATGGLLAGQPEVVDEVITTDALKRALAQNPVAVQVAYQRKDFELAEELLELQIESNPSSFEPRKLLATMYFELGEKDAALMVLEEAVQVIPDAEAEAEALRRQFDS